MAIRLFEGKKHAENYWKYRLSPSELFEEAVKFLQKQKAGPFELAVDVGCGSGQGTLVLAKHFDRVLGTDVSPAQLEMALEHSMKPNITYSECSAEKLPVAESSVDLLMSSSAFHWFDGPRFLQEVHRVLKPGAVLALFDFVTADIDVSFSDCCQESLHQVCREFHSALNPYWSPLVATDKQQYLDAYSSIPYSEKEWHESVTVKRLVPLSSYIGLVESFSSYQALLKEDPEKAASLSRDVLQRLMAIMKVTSAETEVLLSVKYYYMFARKPHL